MTEEELFNRAIEMSRDEREAFLREACGDDDALRTGVESLLAGHEGTAFVLDTPLGESDAFSPLLEEGAEPASGADASFVSIDNEPIAFGDYQLEKEIARGAMGVVYRAEQTSLKRTVAIALAAATAADAQDKSYPESLQKWVDGGKYIKHRDLDVFVHTSGEAPIKGHGVLIVHGYPGSSWDFSNVVANVEKETKVVVPDMIGFGQSETPLTGTFKDNFSLMKQADLYEAVAKSEGLETVTLVAHDMGQTVGLELMARQEEGKLPFRIKHAILLNGSTLVDMVELTPGQQKSLKMDDKALTEAAPADDWKNDIAPSYGSKMHANKDALKLAVDCQVDQIFAKDGALVMSNIVRYLLERKEFYNRWVGTLSNFDSAPLTVIWGKDDPVAVVAMSDRIKAWRPYTDLYKLDGVGHWPSIEAPDFVADVIIHRLATE